MRVTSTASISEDGLYRYDLVRLFGDPAGLQCTFVMLNPSTADAETDDPTIRRCLGFAQSTGHTSLRVVNLYALRTPYPKSLWVPGVDPVGPDNDRHLQFAANRAAIEGGVVIAAWGAHAQHSRAREVSAIFGHDLWCFGVNANRSPKHPLYLPNVSNLPPDHPDYPANASTLRRWTQ